MVSRVFSAGLRGIDGYIVTAECFLSSGLPRLDIVGLPTGAVSEAGERVRAAVKSRGFDWPVSRLTVNLAPADTKKAGAAYDLPILLSILAAAGEIDPLPQDAVFLGELSLTGELRPVCDALSMALAVRDAGFRTVFVPQQNAAEAAYAAGVTVLPAAGLDDLLAHLNGRRPLSPCLPPAAPPPCSAPLDFSHVMGQHAVKRALEIAAAGGHNIILSGPPGSGKTLIAKAVANSLSRRGGASTFFLSIKGPELLNKFVGETERQIRAIFARARTLAAADTPVVIFFDEMEALFRTRGTGVSSDVETMIVPQLLAEMDGVESLDNVVIIGASNRADMIDPAVLRPGRLDVRIRVDRPDRAGALDIFSKYLTPRVPIHASEVARFGGLDEAVAGMIERAVEALYTRDETTALFLATLVSGEHKRIYLADLVSGALIAGIVERAKKYAIKDALSGEAAGLTMGHLLRGVHEEMNESLELAATSSPEDWARTSGLAPEIVSVKPIGVVK